MSIKPRKSISTSMDIWVDNMQQQTAIFAPSPTLRCEQENARPRRRRVSAILAEKGFNNMPREGRPATRHPTKESELQKDPRRRTIYVPSDDTTIMTIHPGVPCNSSRNVRAKSPDLGFDLITLQEEDPDQLIPASKKTSTSRKSRAAAPKRCPLQQSSRPLQAVSSLKDMAGKGIGKENIPPGKLPMSDGKMARPSSLHTSRAKDLVKQPAKPNATHKIRVGAMAPRSTSTTKVETSRKRSFPDSTHKGSPSKSLKSAQRTTAARAPLRDMTMKRSARTLLSNSSPPSRSPPQGLRCLRDSKVPSKLNTPLLTQKVQQEKEKYPVLSEDLQRPELYEDSWLSYQEVSITQLINKLFESADPNAMDPNSEDGNLRKQLLAVYQRSSMPLLHRRLQASLLYGALSIPKDLLAKALRLRDDVCLRRKFLDMFVKTYDLSVLRAAAEAIVGRQIPVSSRHSFGSTSSDQDLRQKRAERKVIEGFLYTFFICNEDAVRVKTGIGSITNIARGRGQPGDDFGSQNWSWRRTVLRSLMLILLLDLSKTRAIVHGPLFQTTSRHKSSNSVLQELANMLLPSLGDLSRPLGHLDYRLHYVQYQLQEHSYHIENLATDLRDGVLLARLVELLLYTPATLALQKDDVTIAMPTGEILTSSINLEESDVWVLSQHLKVPCISRAQKLYNTQVALSALDGIKGVSGRVTEEITAEDIVDGHREKTLSLLWGLVSKWGLEALVNWKEVENEIQRSRKRYYDVQPEDHHDPDSDEEAEPTELEGLEKFTGLLQNWARGIARLHGLRVANLTTSFSDGRVLEVIVDEYISCFPAASAEAAVTLPLKLKSVGCSTSFISLFTPSTTRPIPSKDFTIATLSFLASRLLPASRAYRAAVTIQRCYRDRLARREVSKRVVLMRLAAHCATVVQTRDRVVGAAVVLQKAWRRVLDARIGRLVGDVVGFQSLARGWACRKKTSTKGAAKRKDRIRGGW